MKAYIIWILELFIILTPGNNWIVGMSTENKLKAWWNIRPF